MVFLYYILEDAVGGACLCVLFIHPFQTVAMLRFCVPLLVELGDPRLQLLLAGGLAEAFGDDGALGGC